MKHSLMISHLGLADPEFVGPLCEALEKLEFGTVWLTDHIVRPKEYDSNYPYSDTGKMRGDIVAEPLTTLGFMAAQTELLGLGTAVLILPQRNPILVAKQAATVDRLSGGRLRLGVGVGWLEEEFRLLGAEFALRGARTDAYIEIMQALWTREYPVIDAAGIRLAGTVDLSPKPASPDGIPIVVGGHSPAAVRRAARY
jgi:probable F420-dependent oxidoreductase